MSETTAEDFQAQVRTELAALRADNAQLRAQFADLRGVATSAGTREADDTEVSRRHLFRRATALIAGGAGFAVAGSIIGAQPAAATHLPGFGHDNRVGEAYTYAESKSDLATIFSVNRGDGAAVLGFNDGHGEGVQGASRRGPGILGRGNTNGVDGETANPDGSGVFGHNFGVRGFGVTGRAHYGVGVLGDSAHGIGVRAAGGKASLHLVPGAMMGAPTGDHAMGEIFVDSAGAIFQCVSGDPFSSTWVRIGFNALTPARIADTRPSEGPPLNPLNVYNTGPLAPFETRIITVAGVIGPAGSAQMLVPLQASAASFNVTVTNTGAAGFLTIYPADVARPNVSNLNWDPGRTICNAPTVRLGTGADIGKIKIYNGSSGTTHVILDLAGFYS